MSDIPSDLANRLNSLDDGFCNPIRIKVNDEIREQVRDELVKRGWSEQEADAMVKEQS